MILIKVTYSTTQPTIKVTYDVTDITISGGDASPVYVSLDYSASGAATNLTSVGLTMPTGFSVANSPLTQSGTLAVTYASGYSLPSDAEQTTWDQAYNDKINSASVTGTTTKTLTLTQQDGGTITTSWSDFDTAPVTSVFGRTGVVVAAEGDYNLTQLGDVTITSPSTNQVLKYNGSAWVNGTDTDTGLTSVGLTMPVAFTVSNSPLTANGTLAVTAAGTGAQYIKGDGTLATFPTTIDQALRLITEVYNQTGSTITKGSVVYINGAHGNLPTIAKALATGDATSAQTIGIVQSDITNNNNGYIVIAGKLGNLDTQAYADGTQLYLSPTTAGAYTSTKQYAPNHLVYVGIVNRSHPTQGEIEVKIQNGYELDEIHDVSAQSPSDGMIISYVAATSLWTKTNTIDLGTW